MENRKTSLSICENKTTTISEEEEENYRRISSLIFGISTRAVQVLFDSEIHPLYLRGFIKKKIKKIKTLFNKTQWHILFPCNGRFIIRTQIICLENMHLFR